MRARARVVAIADESGQTWLETLSGEPPLVPRRTRTGTGAGRVAQVHLVGGAAGPLGGDQLSLELEVGPGAALRLRTVAASIALPGPAGQCSRVEIHAAVAEGARLEWLPEPLIAAAGCDHRSTSTVELAQGAALVWREELVFGRHGEQPGSLRLTTQVRLAGRTLYHQQLSVGPTAPGWDGPASLHDNRAAGTLLVVNPRWVDGGPPGPTVLGAASTGGAGTGPPQAVLTPLVGPAILVTAVDSDVLAVRRALEAHSAI